MVAGDGISRAAEMSDCGTYRWSLTRTWRHGGPGHVAFLMLNPSTADGTVDDPTIRRCMSFAKRWGYSCMVVRNLFPYRATRPRDLRTAENPTGGERGDAELRAAVNADCCVVAWGASVPFGRDIEAKKILGGKQMWCLGLTRYGKPRHPLYLRADTPLVPFAWPGM